MVKFKEYTKWVAKHLDARYNNIVDNIFANDVALDLSIGESPYNVYLGRCTGINRYYRSTEQSKEIFKYVFNYTNYPYLKEGASWKVVILSTGTLTSARTESALSAFPLRLLYINIVKKQKILNIIKKKHKKYLAIRKKSTYFAARLLLPLPPPPKGMGLSDLNKMK